MNPITGLGIIFAILATAYTGTNGRLIYAGLALATGMMGIIFYGRSR